MTIFCRLQKMSKNEMKNIKTPKGLEYRKAKIPASSNIIRAVPFVSFLFKSQLFYIKNSVKCIALTYFGWRFSISIFKPASFISLLKIIPSNSNSNVIEYSNSLRKCPVMVLWFPHLDYCLVILSDASQELRNILQVLQNSCTRWYVFGIRRDEQISPYRVKLGWLPTNSIESYGRLYFLATTIYKILPCTHQTTFIISPPYIYTKATTQMRYQRAISSDHAMRWWASLFSSTGCPFLELDSLHDTEFTPPPKAF